MTRPKVMDAVASTTQQANNATIALLEGQNPVQKSMQPAWDEPHSNLPFDSRMMRQQFWGSDRIKANGGLWDGPPLMPKNVTGGVITNDTTPLGGGVPMPNYNLPSTPAPFYAFSLFNPAEIDATYGFDPSSDAQLPISQINSQVGNGGGVLTQTVSFNLLFDRTYEVWNGPQHLPPSANYGFGQQEVTAPKNGGPYRFGVLWDVWAFERLCGIFQQADGVAPQSPPTVQLLHVITGGVTIANSVTGTGPTSWTHIEVTPTPSALDFWGWMTSFNVQYTRFDTNMVPTRCAVSLGFQLTYANPAATTNPPGNDPSATPGTGGA
jgi:hypothetical protein